MKFRFISMLLILLAFGAGSELYARVYWPGSGNSGTSGSSGNKSPFHASELPGLSKKPLTEEKVSINGQPLTLEIYQLKTSREMLTSILKKRIKPEFLTVGSDFFRVIIPTGRHSSDRWLFVFAAPDQPVTAFRIEQDSPVPPTTVWPRELPPLPAGSKADMIMEIPRINAVYGSFDHANGDPVQLLVSYSARLASAGWHNAGAEHSPAIRGTGEIYFRNQPERQILWVKFGENGIGAFYMKNIE